ncbi:polysialyltransferase family glycosyltransferase [Nocardiopsis changdeensis]|uniref:polysialyltransferase family glycosyltransferase n=1 Tax=Nocardiopsis changdeensis TaxID=2831969 RepID=UPI003F45BC32
MTAPHRTQIFVATRFFGAASLCASIDAGEFGDHRRILLVADNTAVPEAAPSITDAAGFDALRPRFHEVVSYNDLIRPNHPRHWQPRNSDLHMLRRLFRYDLALEGEVELVVESVQVPPARALMPLFPGASVTVYADGLMSYGPTRDTLPLETVTAVERVLHPDLVPGLSPLLLSEYGIPARAEDGHRFRAVMAEVAERAGVRPEPAGESTALVLGQYLSTLGFLTPEEEAELAVRMVRACARAGYRRIAFKAHPASGDGAHPALVAAAESSGARLEFVEGSLPIEAYYEVSRPDLVVSCFSTALSTASRFYGIPVATMGTDLALERLAPYENSNRMPATIADVTMPRLLDSGEIAPPAIAEDRYREELLPLVRAVGYCMQAAAYPHLREEAAAYLRDYDGDLLRHFKRKRIAALGLTAPGVRPSAQLREASVPRRLARRARSLLRARPS